MKMKTNVGIQTVRRKWGHVLKWKNERKWLKLKENWKKMKKNEKKDEDKWKKMKDIIVSIRPRFQPIHWLPFSVAQFFTLSWVEHLSSNIYVHFLQYSMIWIPYFSIHYHLNVSLKLKLFGGLESNLEFETWDRLKSSFVPQIR